MTIKKRKGKEVKKQEAKIRMEKEQLALKFWRTLHNTHDLLRLNEDRLCRTHGLTAEQFDVLSAIKALDKPVKIADVARYTFRSSNGTSMIVDRMVKAGLIKRVRDRGDRRFVFVSATKTAKIRYELVVEAMKPEIQNMLKPIDDHDQIRIIRLLEAVKQNLASPSKKFTCFSCGASGVNLVPDFRTRNETVGKYLSCSECIQLSDRDYFEQAERRNLQVE